MKGIARATAAVILTVTIAACGANPLAPEGQAITPTVSASLVIGTPTIGQPAPTSTSCGSTSEGVLAGSSTYVVAYGEIPTSSTTCVSPCGTISEGVLGESSTYVVAYGETPTTTAGCASAPTVPLPPPDSPFSLSFP